MFTSAANRSSFFIYAFILTFSIAFTAHAQSANLLTNGSLEVANGTVPSGWTKSYWGTPTPTFAYPAVGNAGTKGASVTLSANSTGDSNWRPNAVAVTAGARYTYTTWYNSTAATEIDAEYTSSSGATTYAWLADVPSSGGAWKQLAVTFTVPSGVTKAVVYQLLDKKGTLTIDDVTLVSLSTTPAPSTPTVTINASPATITTGQSATLTWSSTNTSSCVASGSWTGAKAIGGSQLVSPSATGIYTITCTGAGGSASQSATITVTTTAPTPALTLSSTASSLVTGQSATLNWSSSNVTSCSASGSWNGSKSTAGSQSVSPTANSTYTLTCTGSGGSISRSVTISVSTPATGNSFSEGMVTLSFDDAWASQYTNALPILRTSGLPATFYMISEVIQGSWQDYMTPSMAVAIANAGYEIADHTITHTDLTTISASQITNEITASRTYLQNLTGKSITTMAYPYGSLNASVKSLVQQAGYASARGVDDGQQNTPKTDKYNLFSRCIESSDTLASIKAQIDKAKANKTWYILCLHEIKTGADQYATPPAELQQIIDYIKQVGIRTVTVSQGRSLMAN